MVLIPACLPLNDSSLSKGLLSSQSEPSVVLAFGEPCPHTAPEPFVVLASCEPCPHVLSPNLGLRLAGVASGCKLSGRLSQGGTPFRGSDDPRPPFGGSVYLVVGMVVLGFQMDHFCGHMSGFPKYGHAGDKSHVWPAR